MDVCNINQEHGGQQLSRDTFKYKEERVWVWILKGALNIDLSASEGLQQQWHIPGAAQDGLQSTTDRMGEKGGGVFETGSGTDSDTSAPDKVFIE